MVMRQQTNGRQTKRWQQAFWTLALGALCAVAQAQDPFPPPAALYADNDPAAVRPDPLDPRDRDARRQLDQVLKSNPGNVPARVLDAWNLFERGNRGRATQAFEDAIKTAPPGSLPLRHAHWNYGWALFASADNAGALSHWRTAADLHGGHPTWVPTTLAIGLWLTGHTDRAIEYYAAAVASDPDRWGEVTGVAEATRDWSANEKLAIEAVQAAWRSRRDTNR